MGPDPLTPRDRHTQVWVRNSGPGSRYPSLAGLALPRLRTLDVSLVFGNRTGVRHPTRRVMAQHAWACAPS